MGWISSAYKAIKNTAVTLVTHPIESFQTGAVALSAAVAHPIATAQSAFSDKKSFVSDVVQPYFQESKTQKFVEVASTALLATGVAGGVAKVGAAIAAKGFAGAATSAATGLATAAITNPRTALAATIAAPVAIGVASTAGGKIIEHVNIGEGVQLGQGIGKVIAGDTNLSKLTLGLIAGSAGLIGAGAIGYALGNKEDSSTIAASGGLTSSPTTSGGYLGNNDEVTTPNVPMDSGQADNSKIPDSQSGIPVLSKDKAKKRRYGKRKPQQPIKITNRVDVANKNYIKVLH